MFVSYLHAQGPGWLGLIMSNLSKSLTVALLSWATVAIRSQSLIWHKRPESLICPERCEGIAHSRSFDLSNLSKWAMSDEQMREFPTLKKQNNGSREATNSMKKPTVFYCFEVSKFRSQQNRFKIPVSVFPVCMYTCTLYSRVECGNFFWSGRTGQLTKGQA